MEYIERGSLNSYLSFPNNQLNLDQLMLYN